MNAPDLVKYFARKWQDRHSANYVVSWGKDSSIFKALLRDFTSDQLASMIDYYLYDMESMFASEGGHTIGIFRSQISKIVVEMQKRVKIEKQSNQTDFERLQEARKKQNEVK